LASGPMSFVLRKLAYALLVVTLITGVVFALRGPQGISVLYEKRRQVRELQEQNANLMKEVQERRERINQLRGNPAVQEEEIRRRYKLLKPGETTFILPDAPKTEEPKRPQ